MELLKGAVTQWLEVWRSKPPHPGEPPNCSHLYKSTERSSWHLPQTGSWNSNRETESYHTRVFGLDVFGCWWWLGGRHLCLCLVALVRVLVTLLSHRQIYADKRRVWHKLGNKIKGQRERIAKTGLLCCVWRVAVKRVSNGAKKAKDLGRSEKTSWLIRSKQTHKLTCFDV